MLGTKDWEGKGMLGDEEEDFRLDLRGFPFDSSTDEVLEGGGEVRRGGECMGEERGKGTALKLCLSRRGGRPRSLPSSSSSSL